MPRSSNSVTVRVPAKVNLQLAVGPREADGFHNLVTAFQAISIYDDVTITKSEPGSGITIAITGDHTHGVPADATNLAVQAAQLIADEYDLWIIEDACHAPGGYFIDSKGQQQNCGNGKFANLAIFSFHPVKHIACGEGGMITTNDETLYKKDCYFSSLKCLNTTHIPHKVHFQFFSGPFKTKGVVK